MRCVVVVLSSACSIENVNNVAFPKSYVTSGKELNSGEQYTSGYYLPQWWGVDQGVVISGSGSG